MASPDRKLFPSEQLEENSTSTTTVQTCLYFCDFLKNDTGTGFCPQACLAICPSICKYSLSILILPPDSSPQPNKPHNLSPILIAMLIILASAFLLITFYVLFTKLYHHDNRNPRTRPRRSRSGVPMRSDPLDEEHGRTVVFHPIWYIPTVGLNPSVISSIAVHKYGGKKEGAVHVEGTDCAVCLAEFQEGDQLRVLSKCSHVFHIPCIDTWLRSHTNCPICRAPVVVSLDHTAEKSSPSLGEVAAATEDHPSDGDQVRINIMRRSASMDVIEGGEINKGSGFSNSHSQSQRWSLVSRSMSCSANIFSSR